MVFAVHSGRIGSRTLHTIVIVDHSHIDGRSSLRNKLSPTYGLTIPIGGAVEGDLDILAAA